MDSSKKLIVGCDLCEDYTQISCYSNKSLEPIPVGNGEDENCAIPTALCVKTDSRQWLYGEEAIECAKSGNGILVEQLLYKLQHHKETELFGQTFSATSLMEKFLRKSLSLIKKYFPVEPITKLVVTVRYTHPLLVEGIYEALSSLGLEKDRVVIISHAGAYLYYALCQDKALWMNDVGLFDFTKEGMVFYHIRFNRRAQPMIAGLSIKDYSDQLSYAMLTNSNNSVAHAFESLANTALHKQIITTLYFTGSGFDGNWAQEAMKPLCAGRRVFMGQNLFTKGACYAAKELSGDQQLKDILLLNDDMITTSISLKVYLDTKYQELPLTKYGDIWYEVNHSIDVIPEGVAELEIILKSIMSRDQVREKIYLNNLPERPDKMTRLNITLTCKDRSTAVITITDLGFGEFYPETGKIMEYTIEI